MNKTLLLFIVDFLFLNLIALTRWEIAPQTPPPRAQISQVGAAAPTRNDDLVATMRESLTDEQAASRGLAQKLANADRELAERGQNLAARAA